VKSKTPPFGAAPFAFPSTSLPAWPPGHTRRKDVLHIPVRLPKYKRTAPCPICGAGFIAKHTGRKRRFCSDHCRDEARRNRTTKTHETEKTVADALTKPARYPTCLDPRNGENSPVISNGCKAVLRGRRSIDKGLWRQIVEIEVIAGRKWREVVSSSGVVSYVSRISKRALREDGSS
jgi:hypothetical protein